MLPVDFVLQDGRVSETIGPGDQQFDVGPKTQRAVRTESWPVHRAITSGRPAVAFHNGVFGMFEDPRFEEGTRRFIGQLKRLKDCRRRSLRRRRRRGRRRSNKYGQPDDVTHCFTAGGTVLNALGSEPVPYLVALAMAARSKGRVA